MTNTETSTAHYVFVPDARYTAYALQALREVLPDERITVTDALLLRVLDKLDMLREVDVHTV